MKMIDLVEVILGLPKTLYVNFKILPPKEAIRLPILVSPYIRLRGLKRGCIRLKKIKPAIIRFGFSGTDGIPGTVKRGLMEIKNEGCVTFEGKAFFGYGIGLACEGQMVFGDTFYMNVNGSISCHEEVRFGDDVLLGWNVHIIDSDNHTTYENGTAKSNQGKIQIGNHVWICAFSSILKNTKISDHSVVGYRSYVIDRFEEDHVLIGGSPAKILKTGFDWSD